MRTLWALRSSEAARALAPLSPMPLMPTSIACSRPGRPPVSSAVANVAAPASPRPWALAGSLSDFSSGATQRRNASKSAARPCSPKRFPRRLSTSRVGRAASSRPPASSVAPSSSSLVPARSSSPRREQ
eukprot:5338646-Prymnesium_polylepis.1